MSHHNPPLQGITVLAFEHAIAAPLCTRQLAELGARVVKVERRGQGDFARGYDTRTKGQSSHFIWTNRSKQSLTLDLKHPGSKQILTRLIAQTDVLIQNLAPSAARRMGLSYEDLHGQYKQLIVCNISGYGDDGPYKDKKAYDLLVQAESGFLSVTGTPDELVKSGISIADIAAGMQAHSAILAALILRSRTGQGSKIDISMLEAMVEWMGFPLNYSYEGAQPPIRSGADHASIYPYGVFTSSDGKAIMIGLQNDREWQDFCAGVLGDPELTSDVRFSSNQLRSDNRVDLKEIIESAFSQLDKENIQARLDKASIAYADVNTMQRVWQHPQLHALGRMVEIETPGGVVKSFLPPGNNNQYDAELRPVPGIGEHTEEVLANLGYSAEEIAGFYSEGIV